MFFFSARMNVAMQSIEPSLISADSQDLGHYKVYPCVEQCIVANTTGSLNDSFQLPGHLILERFNFVLDFASL